ncbi:MAG: hypothetical protein ABI743_01530 [bacterium]
MNATTTRLLLSCSLLMILATGASAATSTSTGTTSAATRIAAPSVNRGNPDPDVKGAAAALKDAGNMLAHEGLAKLANRARAIAADLKKGRTNAAQARQELQRLLNDAQQQGASQNALNLLQQALQALNRLDA